MRQEDGAVDVLSKGRGRTGSRRWSRNNRDRFFGGNRCQRSSVIAVDEKRTGPVGWGLFHQCAQRLRDSSPDHLVEEAKAVWNGHDGQSKERVASTP